MPAAQVPQDPFIHAFFALIIAIVLVLTVIVSVLAKQQSKTFSSRYFLIYFGVATIGWCLAWVSLTTWEAIPFNLLAFTYLLSGGALLLAILYFNRRTQFTFFSYAILLAAVVSAALVENIIHFALLESIGTFVLLLPAFVVSLRRMRQKKNLGHSLLTSGILLGLIAAVGQLVAMLVMDKFYFYLFTTIGQSVAFLLVGLGLITALLIEERRQLISLSMVDPLTGVLNRRGLVRGFEKLVGLGTNRENNLHALAVDIDFFKSINDRYGHAAGDDVLEMVGNVLTSLATSRDICCRLGGEEFLCISVGRTDVEALQYAEKIRSRIEQLKIKSNQHIIALTTSVGVANYQQHELIENLIHRADTALYRAKEAGRNRVESDLASTDISPAV